MAVLQGKPLQSTLRKFTNLEHVFLTDDMPDIHDELSSKYHKQRRTADPDDPFSQSISYVTTSFQFFVAALVASGRRPITISTAAIHQGMMYAGPSDCSALLRHSNAFSNLQCLDLT